MNYELSSDVGEAGYLSTRMFSVRNESVAGRKMVGINYRVSRRSDVALVVSRRQQMGRLLEVRNWLRHKPEPL